MYFAAADVARYQELSMRLQRRDPDLGSITVAMRSDLGEVVTTISLPFRGPELDAALASVAGAGDGRIKRSVPAATLDPAKDVGSRLFSAMVEGELGAAYRATWFRAAEAEEGVRLRIVTGDAELAAIPWELLYDEALGDFVALSTRAAVVREWPSDRAPKVIEPLTPPLRVLAVDWSGGEPSAGRRILSGFAPAIELDVIDDGAIERLVPALRSRAYDVLHLFGPGGSRTSTQDAQSFGLRAPSGPSTGDGDPHQHLSASMLAELPILAPELKLVFLAGSNSDAVAAMMARNGVSALGFRGFISTSSVLTFSEATYGAWLEGGPLEAAVTTARLRVDSQQPGAREWSAAVFYCQTRDAPSFVPERSDATDVSGALLSSDVPATPPADPELRERWEFLSTLVNVKQTNLDALMQEKAKFGDDAPRFIDEQISETEAELGELNEKWSGLA